MVVEVAFGENEILDLLTMTRSEIIKCVLQRLRYYKNQDGETVTVESQSQSKSSSLSFISFGSDLFLLQILPNLKQQRMKLYADLSLNTKIKECDRIDLLTISKTDAS